MKYKMPVISKWTSYKWWLFIFIFFITAKAGTLGGGVAIAETYIVWGNFTNALVIPPDTNPPVDESTSATFFGGHVDTALNDLGYPVKLTDGTFTLESSSFGQAVSKEIPYSGFETMVLEDTRKLLYYDYADDSVGYEKKDAAFRYKVLLYSTSDVHAQFEKMEEYWTKDERTRAAKAADSIKGALMYSPNDNDLRNALLDIYYDIAVAEVALANEKLIEVKQCAMGLKADLKPQEGETLISSEISLLEEIVFGSKGSVPAYDNAMENYFTLLTDPMGIDMNRVDNVDANEMDMPFGYYLFKEEAPNRSFDAPYYVDPNNSSSLIPLIDIDKDGKSDLMFSGFKDLALLLQIERDMTSTAAELARLYVLRGSDQYGDIQRASNLIRDIEQRSYTEGTILNGLIEDSDQVDDKSGLEAAQASWAQALSSLSGIKSFIDGGKNPLGLDKDFLVLVQADLSGTYVDTFDYFVQTLIPYGDEPKGALGDANKKLEKAKDQYDKVMTNGDQLAAELKNNRNMYEKRLLEITGALYNPDDPDPEYDTPEDNEGSEIFQQNKNIELAIGNIKINKQEIENLNKEIEIEIERQEENERTENLIAQTYIYYGDKQAELTKEIAEINAYQAYQNGVTSGWSSVFSFNFSAPFQIKNGENQADAERDKGALQAQKEKYEAQQSAEIVYLNSSKEENDSEARVKTLYLRMSVLAIESQQELILYDQAIGKLVALYNEKAYLESRWNEDDAALGDRYYADPSHRLILDQYILDADYAFDTAQFWVFAMARALDYKWNRTVETGDTIPYTSNSVFLLRNAEELTEMAKALFDYDSIHNLGERHGTQYVTFSLREDFLGYKRYDEENNKLYYPDPQTGEMVDALTAFHSYLMDPKRHDKPKDERYGQYDEVVHIEFSTAKEDDVFFSRARWNEKIKYIKVKINAQANDDQALVWLEQSGTGYIRTQFPEIEGQMTEHTIRRFYLGINNTWEAKDGFGFAINALITDDPNVPDDTYEKKEFSELTPAVSSWILELPLKRNDGTTVLKEEDISDVEISFNNYYKTRD